MQLFHRLECSLGNTANSSCAVSCSPVPGEKLGEWTKQQNFIIEKKQICIFFFLVFLLESCPTLLSCEVNPASIVLSTSQQVLPVPDSSSPFCHSKSGTERCPGSLFAPEGTDPTHLLQLRTRKPRMGFLWWALRQMHLTITPKDLQNKTKPKTKPKPNQTNPLQWEWGCFYPLAVPWWWWADSPLQEMLFEISGTSPAGSTTQPTALLILIYILIEFIWLKQRRTVQFTQFFKSYCAFSTIILNLWHLWGGVWGPTPDL